LKKDNAMNSIIQFILPALGSLILALLLIPVIKNMVVKVGLIDKPNARKVHSIPVPLAGGISIAVTTIIALILNPQFVHGIDKNIIWLVGAIIMLVVGALDDRFDIKPIYRLTIQMSCALAVAYSGIRINSFYGLFGIETMPVFAQYGLTIIVITGVVNAYNLMDGIDGLMGGLSLVAASVLGIISYQLNQTELTILCLTLIGSVVGFLKHNLSRKKIFMGDAGSLFLGFAFVVMAIKLLNVTDAHSTAESLKVLLFVTGIFLVPVLDSLRVYRARIKKGTSPFKADRTHIHHLFLFLGLTHRRTTFLIIMLACLILVVLGILVYLIPVVWIIVVGVGVFVVVTTFLTINHSVQEWKEKTKELERR
jgi:UDP-GlcNAc:undecaprenyl-phosphate/decaprenyl-phosphate GlcNAc-1-phosphate transferase